jgi:hypothetical protein
MIFSISHAFAQVTRVTKKNGRGQATESMPYGSKASFDTLTVYPNYKTDGTIVRPDYSYWFKNRKDSLNRSVTRLQINRIVGNTVLLKDSTKVVVRKPE